METDITPFFKQYEELAAMAGGVFERVKKEHPECVKCATHCSDCCHALFDLTLIEALYINHQFKKKFKGKERDGLLDRSDSADRKVYKIKKKAFKDLEAGKKEDDILVEMAKKRVKCPLLNDKEECDLYEYRPITCRLYGIPTSIGNTAHTCGMSGFVEGKQYPTVKLDIIQSKLYEISAELVKAIKSKHVKIADMLVPLSMALLTDYNEECLGITTGKEADQKQGEQK